MVVVVEGVFLRCCCPPFWAAPQGGACSAVQGGEGGGGGAGGGVEAVGRNGDRRERLGGRGGWEGVAPHLCRGGSSGGGDRGGGGVAGVEVSGLESKGGGILWHRGAHAASEGRI